MTWTLLAPASAIVIAVWLFAWSMHRVEAEVSSLRDSLRRSRAAAVATDDLRRHTRAVAMRGAEIERDARSRADLRRTDADRPRR